MTANVVDVHINIDVHQHVIAKEYLETGITLHNAAIIHMQFCLCCQRWQIGMLISMAAAAWAQWTYWAWPVA